MLRKFIVFYSVIHFSTAMIASVKPSADGKSLIVTNQTEIDVPQYDFEYLEAVLENNATTFTTAKPSNKMGTKGQNASDPSPQAQVQCPSIFIDLMLSYFTAEIADPVAFQTTELPPFLQVRFSGGPGNTVVREYIKTTFTTLGWTVEEDASVQVTPLGFLPFKNVIATFNPQFPKRLVLACHFDSKFSPTGFIGAIDAAVPCALLIDLAKRLNELFVWASAPVAIQMIFFDGEEPYVNFSPTDSLYGSKNLANIWANTLDPLDATKNKLQNIDYFILLDVLGHTTTQFERYYTETDDVYTQLLTLEVCLALKGFLLRPLPLTRQLFSNARRTIDIYDDHVPFRQRGVNIMHLVTFPFPPQWHTLQDNAAIVDYTVIEDFNRILRVFIANYYVQEAYRLI